MKKVALKVSTFRRYGVVEYAVSGTITPKQGVHLIADDAGKWTAKSDLWELASTMVKAAEQGKSFLNSYSLYLSGHSEALGKEQAPKKIKTLLASLKAAGTLITLREGRFPGRPQIVIGVREMRAPKAERVVF